MPAELVPTVATSAPATGRAITWLVDNAEAWRTMLSACRAARTSIWMTQLAFDADCVAYLPDDASPAPDEGRETRVADVLLEAARERGVQLRILLNASLLLDTARALRAHVAAAGADPRLVRIRGIDRFPQLLHAKIVVVDGEVAFLVGSPFVNGYWDDSDHRATDARRTWRELGGRPLHDLTTQLRGAGAIALARAFVELWNGADDVDDGDVGEMSPPEAAHDATMQVVRSAPRPRHAGQPAERAEILPALLDAIAKAERLVYIEHQYMSSVAVIDALADALRRCPALEVIVVLNQNPDVTAYRGWQNRRLASSGLFGHARVGLFSIWTVAPSMVPGRTAVNQVFIHSKLVSVDDRWALVGSANLDGVSLSTYGEDFSRWPGQRVFRGVRNFDVGLVVEGATDPSAAASVLELRTALWREHLDAPDLAVSATPPGGWLASWRDRAAANAATLGGPTPADSGGRLVVLPYSRSGRPRRQLRDAGVPAGGHELDVCFDPSWVEVHLSPNWLRNVFA